MSKKYVTNDISVQPKTSSALTKHPRPSKAFFMKAVSPSLFLSSQLPEIPASTPYDASIFLDLKSFPILNDAFLRSSSALCCTDKMVKKEDPICPEMMPEGLNQLNFRLHTW
jgi:hypothetical protein